LLIFKSLVAVFVDESGAKSLCHCVALGAVAFQPRPGVSYLELGRHLVEGIKRMLRVGGELKWRDVVRRGKPEAVLALIQTVAEVRYTVSHYTGEAELAARLEEIVQGADLVVLDNQLLPKGLRLGVRTVERDSRRVPGIQLADVVAGYARQALCRRG